MTSTTARGRMLAGLLELDKRLPAFKTCDWNDREQDIFYYKGLDSNLKMTSLPGDLCVDATALRKESSITGQNCIKSRQQKWKIQKL